MEENFLNSYSDNQNFTNQPKEGSWGTFIVLTFIGITLLYYLDKKKVFDLENIFHEKENI